MGRELHDGLCQQLAGIAALSTTLARTLARKLAPAAVPESAAAREIGKLLSQSIRHARGLARGLDPLNLQAIGLVAALADFCLNTGALFEITCDLRCEPLAPKVAAHRKPHLFRIVQEAVNNAIAHGRAKWIEVSLTFQNGQGTLAIQDDGTGLGDSRGDHHGIGLHTMGYRARLIGASLEIKRRSPRGTIVTCLFPQPPAASTP